MKDFIKVMKALSEANRVKIVKMLQHKMMCVCEMQAALQITQPSVSKHLKILEDAGLVDSKKDGLWVNYLLTDGVSSPYAAALLGNLRHWLEQDREIVELTRARADADAATIGTALQAEVFADWVVEEVTGYVRQLEEAGHTESVESLIDAVKAEPLEFEGVESTGGPGESMPNRYADPAKSRVLSEHPVKDGWPRRGGCSPAVAGHLAISSCANRLSSWIDASSAAFRDTKGSCVTMSSVRGRGRATRSTNFGRPGRAVIT